MEIKELSFLENLSGNGNKTSAMDSVIGGNDDDSSYIYDLLDYFLAPLFKQEIEETEPEPEMDLEFAMTTSAPSAVGVPESPFK